MIRFFSIFFLIALCCGCSSRYRKNHDRPTSQFTLGEVQLQIRKGMSQTQVAQALGSPNIVTQDSEGRNAWVYDKKSTNVEYYNSNGGFWLVIVGAGGNMGAASSNQNTLTVVIKFDAKNEVDNITYHSSQY